MIENISKKKKELKKINRKIENLKKKERFLNEQFGKKLASFPEYKEQQDLIKIMHYHERLVIEYGDKIEEKQTKLLLNNQDKLPEIDEFKKIQEKEKELYIQRDALNNELAELEKNVTQPK